MLFGVMGAVGGCIHRGLPEGSGGRPAAEPLGRDDVHIGSERSDEDPADLIKVMRAEDTDAPGPAPARIDPVAP